jgi:ElaB/YqjD/DUF883 family membrane-anchored ribosome-binding protein
MGDKINISGTISGSNLIIGSTVKDSQLSASQEITNADQAELLALIQELEQLLKSAPPEKQEEAEAVAESTKELVDAASAEQPSKTKFKLKADQLKAAAQTLAEAMPSVVAIATNVIAMVAKMKGF